MRFIGLLLIICSVSLTIQAHEEPSKTLYEKKEKERTRLRIAESGISRITAWKFLANEGLIPDKGSKVIVQEYDVNGNMTAIEAYKNDSLTERVEYSFGLSNNMMSDIDYSADKKMLEKNVYQYDSIGRVISGIAFSGDEKSTARYVIERAGDKKSVTFSKFKSADSLEYRIEYLYTSDYDLSDYAEANKYDRENKLILRVQKKFNPNGKQSEKAVYGDGQSLSYTFYYEYNDRNDLSSVTRKAADGSVEWKDTYTCDQFGNIQELKSYDSDGLLQKVIRYTFEYHI